MNFHNFGSRDGFYRDFQDFRREAVLEFTSIPFSCLEIGPFTRPTFLPSECELETLDYYTTEELKAQAVKISQNPNDVIDVKYVCKSENYRDLVDRKFDVIVAAHVVEHVVGLVKYFQMIRELLNDNGLFLIVLPDKKFGFDKFRVDTTLAEILFEYFYPDLPWKSFYSLQTALYYDMSYINGKNMVKERLNLDVLINSTKQWQPGIHAHVFQFEVSTRTLFAPLCAMKLIDFDIIDVRMCNQFGEFCILFKAKNNNTSFDDIADFYNPAPDTVQYTKVA
jgi:SAM-dependent methyltransferase